MSQNIDSKASSCHAIVRHRLRLKEMIMKASGKRIKSSKSLTEKRMDYQSCKPCNILYLQNHLFGQSRGESYPLTHPTNTDTYMPSHY